MSQPSLANPSGKSPTQKQQTDIYTVMLIIAFLCIVVSCFLLYKELARWGSYPWWNTSASAWVGESPTWVRASVSEIA